MRRLISTTTTPRTAPTLSALPPVLKKRILSFLREIDEDDQNDDDEGCCGGAGGHEHHDHDDGAASSGENELAAGLDQLALSSSGAPSNVSNVSLINKEWHAVCASVIWQSPDLAERSLESLVYFHQHLLPKYAEHVESLYLVQNSELILDHDDVDDEEEEERDVDEERENQVLGQVEQIARVSPPADAEIRATRARSLLLAEIVKGAPNLVKVEFDSPELALGDDDDAAPDLDVAAGGELEDHVLAAVQARAAPGSANDTISHLGYSVNPISATTYADVAALVAAYRASLRSLRLDCNSPRGDPAPLFRAVASVAKLESLDLADSDFTFDVAALGQSVAWPLRRLVLGEFLELAPAAFATLVNRFAPTLTILGLDGCPYLDPEEEEDDDAAADARFAQDLAAAGPVHLANLETLEIATNHKVAVLEWIAHSAPKLARLQVGFCPNFELAAFVKFVERHRDSLRDLEVDVATFSHEEVVTVGTLCDELGIAFVLVSSEFDDYLGGDFDDDDGDAEWEDEE
ncbi:hypothetical protein JCM11491_006109 [Sporobolomyces phaffii]